MSQNSANKEDILLDLRSLKIFSATCKMRSMVDAAEQNGITQAAVSLCISRLEERLKTKLIDTSVRPLRLTSAGVLLDERARRLLDYAQETSVIVGHYASGRIPRLRVSLINSVIGSLPASAFEAIRQRFRIEYLTVRSGIADNLNTALLSGDVDLIVTTENHVDIDGCVRMPFVRENFFVVTPPNIETVLDFEQLTKTLPFIGYSHNTLTARSTSAHFTRIRFRTSALYEFDDSRGLMDCVASGLGWTVATPLLLLEGAKRPDQVNIHQMPGPGFSRDLSLYIREQKLQLKAREISKIFREGLTTNINLMRPNFPSWLPDCFNNITENED